MDKSVSDDDFNVVFNRLRRSFEKFGPCTSPYPTKFDRPDLFDRNRLDFMIEGSRSIRIGIKIETCESMNDVETKNRWKQLLDLTKNKGGNEGYLHIHVPEKCYSIAIEVTNHIVSEHPIFIFPFKNLSEEISDFLSSWETMP